MQFQSLFIFFYFGFFIGLISAHETTKPEAQKYFYLGQQYLQAGEIQSAVKAFKKAIKKDRKFAEAYYQLAVAFMKKGTIEGRMDATYALEKALRFQPKNVKYHLTMAHLLLKKDMKGAARSRFKKVLKLDPKNAEAYFYLGLLKEKDMLWYKDMISPHEATIFYFDDYAMKDMEEAASYFKKAIEIKPDYADAYYHLALMYYELRDYVNMVDYLQKAIKAQPENKDYYLFLGLAFHKMGNEASAFEYYNRAKQHMAKEELAFYESIEPLLNSDLKEQYATLDDSSRKQFVSVFWKQRDPLFLTNYNERLLEHYGRIAYANLRFGFPEKGIAGWQTDRGKTYIRFGEPVERFHTRPSIDVVFDRNPLNPSSEYWHYPDFDIVFVDPYLSKNYEFKRSFYPEEDSKYIFEKLIEKTPDRYYHPFKGKRFDMPLMITQFKADSGKTRVELYYGIPSSEINLTVWGDTTRAIVKQGTFVFDLNWNEVTRYEQKRRYGIGKKILFDDFYLLIDRNTVILPPGTYNFALEVMDEATEKVGSERQIVNVRSFKSNRLQISDLLLASKISAQSSLPVYNFGNLEIIPTLSRNFTPHQPIFVYFEIYNLVPDSTHQTRYRIETVVRPASDIKKPLLANLLTGVGNILGLSRKKTEVSTSFDYQGNTTDEFIYHSVELTNPEPGKYELIIRVTDLNSKASVQNQISFNIIKMPHNEEEEH